MKLSVALCLPRDAGTVAVIRRVTSGALHPLGVTESCIDEIVLALSEACTNVVVHAAAADEFEVRLDVENTSCAITILDTAEVFDTDALPTGLPEQTSSAGRGIAIIRALMDHTDFRSEPETGTVVHLVKQLQLTDTSPLLVTD